MNTEFKKYVEKYNGNSDHKMQVIETKPESEYYTLEINGKEITSGDEFDIADRVKQINREEGLNF